MKYELLDDFQTEIDDYAYAPLMTRFKAYLIDWVALMSVFAVMCLLLLLIGVIGELVEPIMVLMILAMFIWNALWEASSYQGTIGKIYYEIRVCTVDGERLTFKRALWRQLWKLFSWSLSYIGLAVMYFTKRKQGIHDLVAKTIVVDLTQRRASEKEYDSDNDAFIDAAYN